MFEFVFMQMTKANMQSYDRFDSSTIFTIKNIGGWPDKFQNIVFKSTIASDTSNLMIKIVPLNKSRVEKRIFEKVMFCFGKGYVFSISSGVRGLS